MARLPRKDFAEARPAWMQMVARSLPLMSLKLWRRTNKRGKETIRALGLERTPLQSKRKERLETLKLIFFLAYKNVPKKAAPPSTEVQDARDLLRRAVSDAGEYAAMVRAAIPRWEKQYRVKMV